MVVSTDTDATDAEGKGEQEQSKTLPEAGRQVGNKPARQLQASDPQTPFQG